MFKKQGTTCRESRNQECDLAEFCTGKSELCPENTFRHAGTPCAGGKAYCFEDMCKTLDGSCEAIWGAGNAVKGKDSCFDENMKGDSYGNCGEKGTNNYVKCSSQDKFCGQLWCSSPQPGRALVRTALKYYVMSEFRNGCKAVKIEGMPADELLELDHTGTKCGDDSVCFERKCRHISTLNLQCQPKCGKDAVCNNKGKCQKIPVDGGWGPTTKKKCSKCSNSITMSRECNNPAPQNGGKPCRGPSSIGKCHPKKWLCAVKGRCSPHFTCEKLPQVKAMTNDIKKAQISLGHFWTPRLSAIFPMTDDKTGDPNTLDKSWGSDRMMFEGERQLKRLRDACENQCPPSKWWSSEYYS
jgi:hypothetical protein